MIRSLYELKNGERIPGREEDDGVFEGGRRLKEIVLNPDGQGVMMMVTGGMTDLVVGDRGKWRRWLASAMKKWDDDDDSRRQICLAGQGFGVRLFSLTTTVVISSTIHT